MTYDLSDFENMNIGAIIKGLYIGLSTITILTIYNYWSVQ